MVRTQQSGEESGEQNVAGLSGLFRFFGPMFIPALMSAATVAIWALIAGETACGDTTEMAGSTVTVWVAAIGVSPFLAFLLGWFMTKSVVASILDAFVTIPVTLLATGHALQVVGQPLYWACGG